ncbi:DUF4150 domain-containing protein [Agrobacterium vitis]|nr:DUF4150 domain-containing protein [Agrobacterium vitis]MUO45463.1 DUF4150 domain-containing protein [Agrobacterium vitis]MUP12843.1 DUF4150 domain-containing protein [Agrobacterium vitis]
MIRNDGPAFYRSYRLRILKAPAVSSRSSAMERRTEPMQETVSINGLTLCHKHSDGWVRSTLPDVCRSPDKPVPYTNTAYARDLAKGTTTVFSHGGAMNGIKGSEFYRSFGDEPGSGGGVKSGVHLDRATWLSWSPNVFMEGRNVTRLTDRMLLNKGNTISAGGYFTGPVRDKKNEDLLEEFCKAACACLAAGTMNQRCVAAKLKEWAKANGKNVYPEATYVRSGPKGEWRLLGERADGSLRTSRPPGSRVPDVTDLDNKSIVEGKLSNPKTGFKDRYNPGQESDYQRMAKQNDLTFEKVDFDDCDCDGKGRSKEVRKREAEQAAQDLSVAQTLMSVASFAARRNPVGLFLDMLFTASPAY